MLDSSLGFVGVLDHGRLHNGHGLGKTSNHVLGRASGLLGPFLLIGSDRKIWILRVAGRSLRSSGVVVGVVLWRVGCW